MLMVFTGAVSSKTAFTVSVNQLNFSLQVVPVNNPIQSLPISLWLTAFNLLSFRHLLLNVSGSLFSNLVCFSITKVGRWSDMSLINSPDSNCLCSCLLTYLLSISVAEWDVILLGLVIIGRISNHESSSVKLCVCGWCELFSKSMLWSMPRTISVLLPPLFFLTLVMMSTECVRNCSMPVLGGQYRLPSTIFCPFLLRISTKIDSVWPSSNMSRSSLRLKDIPFLIKMETPPPFLSFL